MIKIIICLLGVGLVLSGCGTPLQATLAPTPEPIDIYYPASLQPWADKLSDCAADLPGASIYFFQQASPGENTDPSGITLFWGQPPAESAETHPYQLGWEQLSVIVNRENTISNLPTDMLRQIFSGQMVSWEGGSKQPIQVWLLPQGEPMRQVFDQALKLDGFLAQDALQAPDPEAILAEVSKNKNAIGYIPQSYVDTQTGSDASRVKTVQVDQALEQSLRQPVLAITKSEPARLEYDLLVCLQNNNP